MIENILIIDDDVALCRSIQLQLGAKGMDADMAHTATDGLARLCQQPPDLVLLDINLPDDDGLTVLKKINEIAADLPVVIITARQDMGATITAMQSGIIFGYVGLIEGIIARIQQELGEKARVVATGGYADLIAKETPVIDIINPDLTLIGLRLIYLMNRA